MARLVWDSVAAPDFSASMNGVRLASDLLARAGQSAMDTVTGLDTRLADQQRMTLAQRMAGFQDAKSYEAALQSGSVLDGLGRLKAEDIMRADARLGTLIGREGDEARLDLTKGQLRSETWNQDRRERRVAAQQAAAPALAEIQAANGDQAKIAEIRAKYAPQLAALDFEDSRAVASDATSAITTAKGWRNSDQANEIGAYDFQRRKTGDAATDNGMEIASAIGAIGGDMTTLVADKRYQAADARTQAAARAALGTFASPDFGGGPVSSVVGGDAAGQGDPYNTILGNGQFGAPPKPLTEMTLGEAISFGRNTLIPNTRNNAQLGLSGGKGSSAVGAYQFTQATLADFGPRVLGANWQNERMTPQVQDRLGRAIFESTNGNAAALKGRWQGLTKLSDAQVAEIGRMPWEQARQAITRVEIGSAIPDPTTRTRVTNLNAANQATYGNTNPADPMLAGIAEAANSSEGPAAVVSRLIGNNGPFAGAKREDINNALTNIMQTAKVNAAAAAVILEQSPSRSRNAVDMVRGAASRWGPVPLLGRQVQNAVAGTISIGDGQVIDYGSVLARLPAIRDPARLEAALTTRQGLAANTANAAAVNQEISRIQSEIAGHRMAQAQTGVDRSQRIQQLEMRLAQLSGAYR